jgi:sortase A
MSRRRCPLSSTPCETDGMRGVRTRLVVMMVVAGSSAFVACGGDSDSANDAVATTTVSSVVADTTDPPATTTVPDTDPPTTTTEAPTTTVAATTVVETTIPTTTTTIAPPPETAPATLPVPVVAPADTRGQEPVVELGSIEIPKIGLAASMFEGIRLTTLDRGPGHWPGTAMPGSAGNVVVAGHRTSHSKPFRHLEQLVPGDEVVFTTAEGRFVYNVTSTEIVYPDAVHIVDQTADRTATLFACHPVGSTKQRIVVHLAMATT